MAFTNFTLFRIDSVSSHPEFYLITQPLCHLLLHSRFQYASWDLAFHMIPFCKVDPQFAKDQLLLFLREWYMSPSGQVTCMHEWSTTRDCDVIRTVHRKRTLCMHECVCLVSNKRAKTQRILSWTDLWSLWNEKRSFFWRGIVDLTHFEVSDLFSLSSV